MATIIINPTLASNGTGSSASPKNTYVGLTTAPGDLVMQVGGTTAVEDVVAGTSGNSSSKIEYGVCDPVTFAQVSDGSQRATIVGATSHAFNLSTRTYLTLRGLRIVSELPSMYAVNGLISASGAHFIDVIDCDIEAPQFSGVRLKGAGDRVIRSKIHNCGADGIFFDGVGFLVDDCDIYDVDINQSVGDCIQVSSTGDVGTVTIRNSHLSIWENDKQVVICTGTAGKLVLDGCDIRGGSACIYTNLPGSEITGNRVRAGKNRFLSAAANDMLVSGNVVSGSGVQELIVLDGAITGLRVYNNVFDFANRGIRGSTSGASFNARNNIFLRLAQGVNYVSGITATMDHNCYDTSVSVIGRVAGVDQSLAGMRALSLETNGKNENPMLKSDYRLRPGSPCIAAGIYIDEARHMGNRRLRPYADIGAYRYHPAPQARRFA